MTPALPNAAPGLVLNTPLTQRRLSDFKLIAFDMDSTLINIECVDEIADAVGKKAEVAAITEAAMRGEIADYKESLRRRVALLKGVSVADMQRVYDERLRLNPGAAELVQACKAVGMKVLLVSGGFTFFTDRIRDWLGIDHTRSNVLELEGGALTGRMVDQPWGDICDGTQNRFDFYTILPGSESKVSAEEEIKIKDDAPEPALQISYYLQVGAFQTGEEADNMKAKLLKPIWSVCAN